MVWCNASDSWDVVSTQWGLDWHPSAYPFVYMYMQCPRSSNYFTLFMLYSSKSIVASKMGPCSRLGSSLEDVSRTCVCLCQLISNWRLVIATYSVGRNDPSLGVVVPCGHCLLVMNKRHCQKSSALLVHTSGVAVTWALCAKAVMSWGREGVDGLNQEGRWGGHVKTNPTSMMGQ